jgi:hypothetical protein
MRHPYRDQYCHRLTLDAMWVVLQGVLLLALKRRLGRLRLLKTRSENDRQSISIMTIKRQEQMERTLPNESCSHHPPYLSIQFLL